MGKYLLKIVAFFVLIARDLCNSLFTMFFGSCIFVVGWCLLIALIFTWRYSPDPFQHAHIITLAPIGCIILGIILARVARDLSKTTIIYAVCYSVLWLLFVLVFVFSFLSIILFWRNWGFFLPLIASELWFGLVCCIMGQLATSENGAL